MPEIKLKSVRELTELPQAFRVPYYQRGYRWKMRQVQQLLDDINAFQPTEKHPFYFLQALAVAKHDNSVHVVDGQQRLTTLSLILNGNAELLKIIYDREANQPIDTYYKDEAQKCICEFLKSEEAKNRFLEKILNHCCFLYYVIDKDKELQTFSALNSGKLPAQDSELVKCLLLSPGTDESPSITQARAAEWDMMERKMRNEAFYAFMTPRGTWREDDRMTVLFRYAGVSEKQQLDEVFPFLAEIQSQIGQTSRITLWKKICAVYYRLAAWHEDPLMYHAFGWYVHRKGRRAPVELRQTEIRETFLKFMKYNSDKSGDDYNGGQNDPLYSYLLLHNVAFCWRRWPVRYDFVRHRKVALWSLEHIYARNQRDLTKEELKQWLQKKPEEEFQEQFKEYEEQCKYRKGNEWLARTLVDIYPKKEDNSIANLAILPKDANSSLNNSLFESKRQMIIAWEEEGGADFWVPPVTKAVFLKSLPGLSMTEPWWSDSDKKAYKEHIDNSIVKFMNALNQHFCNKSKVNDNA